jgi:hypothetical protein
MAQDRGNEGPLERVDLSGASLEDLYAIRNNVLRSIAIRIQTGEEAQRGHDSHSCSHLRNKKA